MVCVSRVLDKGSRITVYISRILVNGSWILVNDRTSLLEHEHPKCLQVSSRRFRSPCAIVCLRRDA